MRPGVRVRWVCGDIGRLDTLPLLEECFDLIYSCGAIHYVPRAVRAKLVPRLKAITREHGLHAHIVFTDRAVYVVLRAEATTADHVANRLCRGRRRSIAEIVEQASIPYSSVSGP